MSPIVDFYRGKPDYQGRQLDDILGWDDDQLEDIHDYIQVLFPLYERSMFNFRAPTLDEDTVKTFRADESLRENLARSFDRMLSFYGLRWDADSGKVQRSDNFAQRSDNWISPFNHNYRRITRIMGSLNTLGLEERARAFFDALLHIYGEHASDIGEETLRYWREGSSPFGTSY